MDEFIVKQVKQLRFNQCWSREHLKKLMTKMAPFALIKELSQLFKGETNCFTPYLKEKFFTADTAFSPMISLT